MLKSWWRRWMPCSAVDWICLASYQYLAVGEALGDMTWRSTAISFRHRMPGRSFLLNGD